ncbi:asparagine synthase-related protein [Burkholderia ambifaria]|uniref:asparagine synthase-related protein n=1 Tax=Burkholderia ambifaria TaxID=152480 RepID=UPI002FE36A0D
MFAIYPTNTTQWVKSVFDRWADRNELAVYVCGTFIVRCSKRWKISRSEFRTCFFEGLAFEWPITHFDANRTRHPCLSQAIGHFTSIEVDHSYFTATRSLYRSTDIFYTIIDGSAIICSELAILVAARGGFSQQQIDTEYCRDFISFQQKFGGHTAFENIKEVMLGECVTVTPHDQIQARFVNQPIRSDADIVDMLTETLAEFTRRFDNTALMFSGGLDSSTLLWALRSNGTETLVVHAESTADAIESEYEEAAAVARDMGCEVLQLIPGESDCHQAFVVDADSRISSPYDIPLLKPSAPSFPAAPFDGNTLVLTGHGGDHVFVQNPENNVCFSALRSGRLIPFLKLVRKLSRLKGKNGFQVIQDNLRLLLHPDSPPNPAPHWLPLARANLERAHYLLRDLDPRSAKHTHLATILLALHSTQAVRGEISSLSPLLLQNVIGHVLATPVEDMFTDTHDRAIIRKLIYAKSGKSFAWRRTKRASSRWFFELLSRSGDNLLESIAQSRLLSSLGIHRDSLLAEIEQNCTIALTPNLKHIVNLYKIDAHLRSIALQSEKILSS